MDKITRSSLDAVLLGCRPTGANCAGKRGIRKITRIQAPGSTPQSRGSRIQDPGLQDPGSRIQDTIQVSRVQVSSLQDSRVCYSTATTLLLDCYWTATRPVLACSCRRAPGMLLACFWRLFGVLLACSCRVPRALLPSAPSFEQAPSPQQARSRCVVSNVS